MPLPVVTDHYLVSAQFQRENADVCINTFCFQQRGSTPTDEQVADDLQGLLDTFYGDGSVASGVVGGYLAPTLFGLAYTIYDLGQPEGGAMYRESQTFRTTPSASTSFAPPDLAAVISWRTNQRGRSFRGRTYIGPLAGNAMADNGEIHPGFITTMSQAAPKLIGDPLTRNASLAVLSRTKGVATEVTGGYIDNAFDVQRRRDPGPSSRTPFTGP